MVNYYGSQPKLVSSLGKRATTLTVMFVDVCGNHMYIIIYVIIGSLSLITGPVVQSLFDWEDGWGISLRIRLAVEVFGATPLQYPLGNLAKNPASDDEKKQLGIHELAPIDSCCSRSSKGIHVFQTLEFARRGTWIHIKLHIDAYIYISQMVWEQSTTQVSNDDLQKKYAEFMQGESLWLIFRGAGLRVRILRNFVAREATPEERDSFLVKNYAHLNDKARGVFRAPWQKSMSHVCGSETGGWPQSFGKCNAVYSISYIAIGCNRENCD